MRVSTLFFIAALFYVAPLGQAEDTKREKLPLIFEEDFEKGHKRWEVMDAKSWTHRKVDGNHVFGVLQSIR